MYQLIGAAFCLAGVAVAWTGDPIVGLLLVVCAIVWAATTPALTPFRRRPKPTMLIRLVE
jgi:drug/metabolite transporter (DMT)-like permease